MSIYREVRKTLWIRKNDEHTHDRVTLEAGGDDQVIIHNLLSGHQTLLSEAQFFDMVEAGARHFGKQVTVDDLLIPCPVCQSHSRLVQYGETRYRRICNYCNFQTPMINSREKADRFFSELSIPDSLS